MPSPPLSNLSVDASLGKVDHLANDASSFPSPANNSSSSCAYAYMVPPGADYIAPIPVHLLPGASYYDVASDGILVPPHLAASSNPMDDLLDTIHHHHHHHHHATPFPNSFASTTQSAMAIHGGADPMQGIVQIKPEPVSNANSPASNPSLGPSPVPTHYPTTTGLSSASALDDQTAARMDRSRSGSLISPVSNHNSPPRTEPAFTFGPADFQSMNSRPDPVNAPHMLAVDEVLAGIVKAAMSAREACSMGQGAEASSKIDEMRKQISLVSKLMAETRLDGPESQNAFAGVLDLANALTASSAGQGHRSTSLSGSRQGLAQPPGLIPNFPQATVLATSIAPSSDSLLSTNSDAMMPPPSSASSTSTSSEADGNRKRCASSVPGPRVNKALRLEPLDSSGLPPLTQPGPLPIPSLQSLGAHPLTSTGIVLSPSALTSAAQVPSPLGGLHHPGPSSRRTPPSGPSSRPASPASVHKRASAAALSGWPMASAAAPMGSQPSPYALSSMGITAESALAAAAANGSHVNSPTTTGSMQAGWPDVTMNGASALGSMSNMSLMNGHGHGHGHHLGHGLSAMHPHDLPLAGPSGLSYGAPFSGRDSRSSSLSNPLSNPLVFGADPNAGPVHPPAMMPDFAQAYSQQQQHQARSVPLSPCVSSEESDSEDEQHAVSTRNGHGHKRAASSSLSKYSPPLKSRDNSRERLRTRSSASAAAAAAMAEQSAAAAAAAASMANGVHGNDIPVDLRAEVDRVFFEFMNKVCSNLDSTDSKGEPIHQTLMAKKMQRLAESNDFRPFKFRIQAFTNGFLEELSKQGYPEEKIAMKKVRNYLWTQPYISRFNEDGKKAKSKGNHIWNIDAKRRPDGGWEFRPFHRKLAGSPPSVAYIGLKWSWTPRIWDPQASRASIHVQYACPNLPPWMSWQEGTLQGIPPPDAQGCDLTVEARFIHDGRNEMLSQTFHINVAPVTATNDISFANPRPMLGADAGRRATSDSVLPMVGGVANRFAVNRAEPLLEALTSPFPPSSLHSHSSTPLAQQQQQLAAAAAAAAQPGLTHQDAQMMQVLTSAAQRVSEEMIAHVTSPPDPLTSDAQKANEMEALVKQQHVLEVTAQALNQEVGGAAGAMAMSAGVGVGVGGEEGGVSASSHALVAVAQQVVFQAARQVATDHAIQASASADEAGVMMMPGQAPQPQQVTVNEVSVATQTAVAQAVELTGPLSSEVDVMMTASSLLQHQTQSRATGAGVEGLRPHSAGSAAAAVYGVGVGVGVPAAPPSFPMHDVPMGMGIVQY